MHVKQIYKEVGEGREEIEIHTLEIGSNISVIMFTLARELTKKSSIALHYISAIQYALIITALVLLLLIGAYWMIRCLLQRRVHRYLLAPTVEVIELRNVRDVRDTHV